MEKLKRLVRRSYQRCLLVPGLLQAQLLGARAVRRGLKPKALLGPRNGDTELSECSSDSAFSNSARDRVVTTTPRYTDLES